jgi:DNA-directed RNA polymerase sigma subunit (sigma70/sigma32)
MQAVSPTVVVLKPRTTRVREEKNKRYANDGSYESVQGMLKGMAIKAFRRVEAMGLGMELDDCMSVLNLGYVQAARSWSADRGTYFSSYCQTVAWRFFNAYIEKPEKERAELGLVSYEEVVGAEAEGDPLELLAGDQMDDSEEDRLDHRDAVRERLASLSPGARRLVTALMLDEKERGTGGRKLRELCTEIGLAGEELRQVKREILAKFDVQWAPIGGLRKTLSDKAA